MKSVYQVDCFKRNIFTWKVIGLWHSEKRGKYYDYFSFGFLMLVHAGFFCCSTADIICKEKKMDLVIEAMIFYLSEMAAYFKVVAFLINRRSINEIFDYLESEAFQGDQEAVCIVSKAKKLIIRFWNVVAAVSFTSNMVNMIPPMLLHLLFGKPLAFPILQYSFLSPSRKEKYKYFLYLQQVVSMHTIVHVNINVDTFIQGVMSLAIAQLDILNLNLKKINTIEKDNRKLLLKDDKTNLKEILGCVLHHSVIVKYCSEIQNLFSLVIFVQFSVASAIICVCLFRFTLPLTPGYCIFLSTYIIVMLAQILVPCWFGTQIIHKSKNLSLSAYSCEWFPCSRRFRTTLLIFLFRTHKPITIVGGKMFELSLVTFTGIMNRAYSFFTLLQNVQNS